MIAVDKPARNVRAYDREGRLHAFYPATIGSEEKPAPSGSFKVRSVDWNPPYNYDPPSALNYCRPSFEGDAVAAAFTLLETGRHGPTARLGFHHLRGGGPKPPGQRPSSQRCMTRPIKNSAAMRCNTGIAVQFTARNSAMAAASTAIT
jgi:hypothetical protein